MRRVLTDAEHAFIDRLIDSHNIINSCWKRHHEDQVKDAFDRAMARRVVRELERILPGLKELADKIAKREMIVRAAELNLAAATTTEGRDEA